MSDAGDGSGREVRPSFSISYFFLFLVTTLIASTISLSVAKFWGKVVEPEEDQKVLHLTMVPAQNIAAVPENITSKLEFTVALSASEKRTVKSLFGFQVNLRNAAKRAVAENVLVYLSPPANVELIEPATITTDSKLLQLSTQSSQKALEGGGVVFTVEQLSPGHEISFSYTGFARDIALGPQWLRAEARAKDWQTGRYADDYRVGYPIGGQPIGRYGTEYGFSPYDPYAQHGTKRLADYTALDVIALFFFLVTLLSALGIGAWLLGKFVLPIFASGPTTWRKR